MYSKILLHAPSIRPSTTAYAKTPGTDTFLRIETIKTVTKATSEPMIATG